MSENNEWIIQKSCKDVGDYELVVERQKTNWNCEQKNESWKWSISYHGSIVSSGAVQSVEQAKKTAEANVPVDKA